MIGRGLGLRVVIGAAWGAWSAPSEEGISRGLRETVCGLRITRVPGRGMVQVLAASMGMVVRSGLPLIKVVRGTKGIGPDGQRAIRGMRLGAGGWV